jgi:pimeloyl-ACP methyl ester carboxylesterase
VTQVVRVPGGRRLSVQTLGAPWGQPVFLLHGTPGVRRGPHPRGIVLYRLGIRLISYDRPGYPGSDRQEDRTVADAAADVKAIADSFGIDRFSVVGRSGGAPHALACAAILNKEVICAAALGSLAPYDADGLDWTVGMADFNVHAYRLAEDKSNRDALIDMLKEHASQVRGNSEGLLKQLWPELVTDDKDVIGDITLRRIIAEVHAEALRDTVDGWVDDIIALGHPWGFDLSGITAPVKLWHGGQDIFSPVRHTYWLHKRIPKSILDIENVKAHFGTVESLPKILAWIAETAAGDSSRVTARRPSAQLDEGQPPYRMTVGSVTAGDAR